MRNTVRAIVVALLALLGAVLLGLTATISTSVQLMGSYALKGTQIPVFNITSDQAIRDLAGQYGVTVPAAGVVNYPASWRPLSPGGFSDPTWDQSVAAGVAALQNLNDPEAVIFGYSQGAVVGSEYKKIWNQQNADMPPGDHPTFVFIGNGDRPSGGVLARFAGIYIPGLDMTATGATPTNTEGADPDEITTIDIAGQYDPIADFPTNPFNMFALANAGMGTLFVHLSYENPSGALLQDQYGDTEYYLIPTYPVPLLVPVQMIPIVGPIAADMLDPLVRLLVEAGYNRTISPGQPTPADFGYFPNPIAFAKNIPVAIMTGLDNGLQDIGLDRPLQTDRPEIGPGTSGQGAYGIGGPPVTMSPTTNEQPLMLAETTVAKTGVNGPVPQVNTPPQQLPSTDLTSTDLNSGPRFNVLRLPLFATPGQTGKQATKPSQPKLANSAGSVVSSVTQSIKAVTKAIKDAADSLKPKKDSNTANADAPAS